MQICSVLAPLPLAVSSQQQQKQQQQHQQMKASQAMQFRKTDGDNKLHDVTWYGSTALIVLCWWCY